MQAELEVGTIPPHPFDLEEQRRPVFPLRMRNAAKVKFMTDTVPELPPETGLVGRKLLMEPLPRSMSNGRGSSASPRSGKRARSLPGPPRFLYAPCHGLDGAKILKGANSHVLVEVRVASQHISFKNEGVRKRLVWGGCRRLSDPPQYTDDSDVVGMLVHGGHIVLPKSGHSPYDFLIVTLRVSRVEPSSVCRGIFPSSEGYVLRSQAWEGAYTGSKVAIEKVMSSRDGVFSKVPAPVVAVVPKNVPGLVPWNGPPKDANGREIGWATETATFDMTNRPCLAYNIGLVSDRGFDKAVWPSRRLWSELLYLETANNKRFEIAKVPAPDKDPKEKDGVKEKRRGLYVRFAQVTKAAITRDLFEKDMPIVLGPMDTANLEPGFSIQKWTTIRWDPSGVTVNGVRYQVEKVFFRRIWTEKALEEWQTQTLETVEKEEQEMASGKKGSAKKDLEKKNSDKDSSTKEDVVSNHSGKTSPEKKTLDRVSSDEEDAVSKAPESKAAEKDSEKGLSEKKGSDTGSSEGEDVTSRTAKRTSGEKTSSDKGSSEEDMVTKAPSGSSEEKKGSDKRNVEKKSGERKEKKSGWKNDSPARDSKKRGAEDAVAVKKERKRQRMEASGADMQDDEAESPEQEDVEKEEGDNSDEEMATKEKKSSEKKDDERKVTEKHVAEKKEKSGNIADKKESDEKEAEKEDGEAEVSKKDSKKNSEVVAKDDDAEKTVAKSDSKKTDIKMQVDQDSGKKPGEKSGSK